MKKLNEGRFLHAKSQIYENEFHVPSFPYSKLSPSFYCSPPPIKDSLPFHQPTHFTITHLPSLFYFRRNNPPLGKANFMSNSTITKI